MWTQGVERKALEPWTVERNAVREIYLPYADASLLGLRVMLALVFGSSGWSDLKDPDARSKSIGMSKGFTILLGVAEFAGALGIAGGVLASWATAGLILVMLGAIYKKTFVWKTGFWG